jgi:hypothetical protein
MRDFVAGKAPNAAILRRKWLSVLKNRASWRQNARSPAQELRGRSGALAAKARPARHRSEQ